MDLFVNLRSQQLTLVPLRLQSGSRRQECSQDYALSNHGYFGFCGHQVL